MPRVVHFDIVTDDADRIAKFYKDTFEWKIQKWDGPMDYWFLMTGDQKEPGIDGAFGMRQDPDDGIVNTIDVKNIDEYVAKIEKHGGEIVRPKMAVQGVGWLVYFKDTEGNLWGMMEDDPSAK
jgi:predicted enzyme related to lactoylglutathione lyase